MAELPSHAKWVSLQLTLALLVQQCYADTQWRRRPGILPRILTLPRASPDLKRKLTAVYDHEDLAP